MINKAKKERPGVLPLIRLKVEHTGYESFNTRRFGQQFVKMVANPKDLLIFQRRRPTASTAGMKRGSTNSTIDPHIPNEMSHTRVMVSSVCYMDSVRNLLLFTSSASHSYWWV